MHSTRIEHLKMIQGIVNRLADSSFKYKGWSITVASALLALAAKDGKPAFALVGLLPVVAFWFLDAYYLRQERHFRVVYDQARTGSAAELERPSDFSMRLNKERIDAELARKLRWCNVAFSKSVLALHGPLLLSVIAVATVLLWQL
jgi:hypothetical protein